MSEIYRKMLIGGQSVEASDGGRAVSLNPANKTPVGTYPLGTVGDVEEAIRLAKEAQPQWANVPYNEKAQIMNRFADLMMEHKMELADIFSREAGVPISFAENFEVIRGHAMIAAYVAGGYAYLNGKNIIDPNHRGAECDITLTVREPMGVCAVICPFNAAMTMFTQKIVPALLCGNAVIIEPASDTPLISIRLCQLLLEAGVPGDVCALITGKGSFVGEYLLHSDKIDMVSLVGSTASGIRAMRASSSYLRPLRLELGGNDACILFEDGDMQVAMADCEFRTALNGQICCSAKDGSCTIP